MSDVADILGLAPKSSSNALDEAAKIFGETTKPLATRPKKPKGMKREVFDLIVRDGIVPAMPASSSTITAFKTKRVAANRGKWVWAPIKSSARQGQSYPLHHWVKADAQVSDYPYAKFDISMEAIEYSDDQYAKYFSGDPTWTREDTDSLMATCQEFDMRWPVVMDRIQLSAPKTMEQIQKRYFTVAAVMHAIQSEPAVQSQQSDSLVGQPTQSSYSSSSSSAASAAAEQVMEGPLLSEGTMFNFEQEENRRKQQDLLFRKTKADEYEENRLKDELKLIDAALKKIKKSVKASVFGANISNQLSASAAQNMVIPAATAAAGGKIHRKVQSTLHPTFSQEPAAKPIPGKPLLQSTRLFSTSEADGLPKNMLKKMNAYLRELGFPENPLPTRAVCDLLDQIRLNTVTLLSLHTLLSKKEKVLEQMVAPALAEALQPPPTQTSSSGKPPRRPSGSAGSRTGSSGKVAGGGVGTKRAAAPNPRVAGGKKTAGSSSIGKSSPAVASADGLAALTVTELDSDFMPADNGLQSLLPTNHRSAAGQRHDQHIQNIAISESSSAFGNSEVGGGPDIMQIQGQQDMFTGMDDHQLLDIIPDEDSERPANMTLHYNPGTTVLDDAGKQPAKRVRTD